MAKINLLPWREELREQRKKEFLQTAALVLIVAAGIIGVGGFYIDQAKAYQEQRNEYLQGEIAELDERIREIRDLQQKREQLLARMRVIQELQGNRPVIVRVFDELVRTLTPGLYYQSVRMNGTQVALVGTAESNNRISAQMRRFDESEWFAQPNLRGIRENPAFGAQASDFQLTVQQVTPGEEPTEGD